MHAQQGQEVLLSQGKVIKNSPTNAAQQGSNMQIGATEEGADITGEVNGTWSSDVLLELLDLLFDGTISTKVVPRILSDASRNQQGASTEAATNTVLAQPSNIPEAVNPGVREIGGIDPPASATGPVGDGHLVVLTGGGGSATMVDLDLTIPHKSGGQMDIKMPGPTAGASHDQVPLSLNGGVHRVPAIFPVGNGADGEDQTVAGEPAGGKGPLTVSTEMEVVRLDENKGPKTSLAQKGPIQSSMVTPRISRHIPIYEVHLAYINLNLDAMKGIKNTHPHSGGNRETFVFMMMNHRNQGESPRTKVYGCNQNFYKYLHKADPTATIILLHDKEEEDGHNFVLITEPASFPSNMLGLHNCIQICNLYTMSLVNRNDDKGNLKLQRLTYVVCVCVSGHRLRMGYCNA
jgi:hypothetical protein